MTIKSGKVRLSWITIILRKNIHIWHYLYLIWFHVVRFAIQLNQIWITVKDPILYPYEDEFGYDISFDIKTKDGNKDYVKIIEGISDEFEIVIKNFFKRQKS